jgi:hypothetical protein
MELRLVTIPAIIAVFSVIIIGLSLQLDTSPPMIVGDSMQARSFPIFLMILNLMLCVILFLQLVKEKPAPVPLEGRETWGSMVLILLFFRSDNYNGYVYCHSNCDVFIELFMGRAPVYYYRAEFDTYPRHSLFPL